MYLGLFLTYGMDAATSVKAGDMVWKHGRKLDCTSWPLTVTEPEGKPTHRDPLFSSHVSERAEFAGSVAESQQQLCSWAGLPAPRPGRKTKHW